jgi:6-phosphogluconolactonase
VNIEILKNADDLARAAAKHFVAKSREAILETGRFTLALSGGSTPKRLYELLADPTEPFRDQITWEKIYFFWSDERDVPPHHPESNYRMAREALLSRVPVVRENVHRIEPENQIAADAAARYETILKRVTGEDLPKLDLILLGLGTDGHTASIFPGSEVLQETKRLVAAPWVEKFKSYRITMTLPLLNNGGSVVFLVSGDEKAEIVKEVLKEHVQYPAQFVRPTNGEVLWMLDKGASADYAD